MSKFTIGRISEKHSFRQTDFSPFASAKVRIFLKLTKKDCRSQLFDLGNRLLLQIFPSFYLI